MDLGRRCEFHAHTFYSDGVLCPMELVRRAFVLGDGALAITDHVDFTNIEHVLRQQRALKGNVSWDIEVFCGVELTHIPVDRIAGLAAKARRLGADIVILHGESPVEPVEAGTNREGVSCADVDILAHPGNGLTAEDAAIARENGVFLELTSRKGHSKGNRNVARVASRAKAMLVVDTDAHEPGDLITQEQALDVALKAGLSRADAIRVVKGNSWELLERLRER
ncbi:MAG: histidinol phosphate phosphatase domain-containing protein [Candidatus Altiarchaeota archaeon]|nr:histidinol phosphate phosphatase domain-containing protein [Candidatus Altiarchaeota archaeon]